jgi:serine/threonine protein kinase
MTPEKWQLVESILQQALDRPLPERGTFLDKACAGDERLLEQTTILVNAHLAAGDFLEEPAIARDARVLLGGEPGEKLAPVIGPYRISERLGAGGMSEVYLAADTRLDRLVALKILPPYFASDVHRLRRFQREARAASALNHPNILTIHEVGEVDGVYFIATEFISGVTIRELLKQRYLPASEIIDIALQVTSALSAAHAAGIVHRDIKPENIMQRSDGLVKILDFGIAKLLEPETSPEPHSRTYTDSGLVMGTVNYMSPEQARGLPVDERTDIWSLGVVLHEMLTGSLPFSGATRMDTIVAILQHEPLPRQTVHSDSESAPLSLQAIVDKCLRKEMAERFRTASELAAELKQVKEELNSGRPIPSPNSQAITNFSSGSPLVRVGWGLLTLLLVVTLGAVLYRRLPARSHASNLPAEIAPGKLYSQLGDAEQFNFIDAQEQRISTLMGDRPVKLDADAVRLIKASVDRYVARDQAPVEPGSERLSAVYTRARPYVPLIARSFAARRVPIMIGIYLPLIESEYRPCAESSSGARGLFQFLPQTAAAYGVARADMCDAEKMTPAAAHYVADRIAELGEDSESLTLVLLSYNRSPEWVRNALRKLRGSDHYQRNFWTLFAQRDKLDETFRSENAAYVPRFFAAAIIGENPERFGLPQPPLSELGQEK